MLTQTRHLLIILLIVLLCISGWLFVKESIKKNQGREQNQPTHYNAFLKNVTYTTYDKVTGQRKNTLATPQAYHYEHNNATRAVNPTMILYERNKSPWHLKAEHAKTKSGTSIVHLWGHVVMHQAPSKNNADNTITTSAMTIYPNRNYAETTRYITFKQPGSFVSAIGARAYLKTNELQLLSHQQGRYTP